MLSSLCSFVLCGQPLTFHPRLSRGFRLSAPPLIPWHPNYVTQLPSPLVTSQAPRNLAWELHRWVSLPCRLAALTQSAEVGEAAAQGRSWELAGHPKEPSIEPDRRQVQCVKARLHLQLLLGLLVGQARQGGSLYMTSFWGLRNGSY